MSHDTGTTHTVVDPRFTYKERHTGKDVVLYHGLLDAAHRAGLTSMTSTVLHIPDLDNPACIVQATVTFTDGRAFSAIGDATPTNVVALVAPHYIRMAETRAKARALRDALNVGMVTLEELGDGGGGDEQPTPRPAAPQTRQDAPGRPEAPAAAHDPADLLRRAVQAISAAPAPARKLQLAQALLHTARTTAELDLYHDGLTEQFPAPHDVDLDELVSERAAILRTATAPAKPAPRPTATGASPKQLGMIRGLARDLQLGESELDDLSRDVTSATLAALTSQQASKLIDRLQAIHRGASDASA